MNTKIESVPVKPAPASSFEPALYRSRANPEVVWFHCRPGYAVLLGSRWTRDLGNVIKGSLADKWFACSYERIATPLTITFIP